MWEVGGVGGLAENTCYFQIRLRMNQRTIHTTLSRRAFAWKKSHGVVRAQWPGTATYEDKNIHASSHECTMSVWGHQLLHTSVCKCCKNTPFTHEWRGSVTIDVMNWYPKLRCVYSSFTWGSRVYPEISLLAQAVFGFWSWGVPSLAQAKPNFFFIFLFFPARPLDFRPKCDENSKKKESP